MFKLQRLEITGFKSFADYTEIVFTGKGITAVVGPNGCGKSNISESIAWVLGEQSAKSLRGQEMKDVIFQGTDKRNPSGMAEVVLHLVRDEADFVSDENELEDIDEKLGEIDEAAVDVDEIEAEHLEAEEVESFQSEKFAEETEEIEKAQAAQVGSAQTIQTKTKSKRRWRPRNFALDFAPGEAVTVSRRLYLSGESEYLLNDKQCRLRDIQDLFAGTGLSGSHYAIIEQGRIGRILSSKPSDRRSLIEEAAGISKFRTRQRAAESRLESAKVNLSRISDIVSEIEKQTRSLQRQANKTRRYKILREELRELFKQTYAAEGRNLTEAVEVLDKNLGKATKLERELFEKVAEKDEAFRTETQTARIAEETLTEIRGKHAENALRRDRAAREKRYQEEQIQELKSRSEGLKGEIKVTDERIRLLQNEIKRLEKSEEKERNEAEKEKLKLQKAEDIYREKLGELKIIETELEAERNEQLQHAAAVERLAEIERQLENNLERLNERIEGLKREGERAEETFTERRKESEKLEKGLTLERQKLEKLHKEKQVILENSAQLREKLENDEESFNKLNKEFSRQKHRLETLAELEEKRAIYAPSVQKLLKEQKKIGVEFQGTLADKFDVDEKAEKAVENLFGGFLQTVLVKTESDAIKTVKYLNENGLGRIPILVESGEWRVESKKDAKSTIADYLGISKDFADILKSVFPREMAAKVVESINKAKLKTNEIFVTLDGDLIIGGKLFVSGKVNPNEKNNSLLAFKRELKELEKSSKENAKEIEKLTKTVERSRQNLAEKENEIVDLQSFIVQVERELLSQEIQAKALAQEIERAERHKKVVSDEVSQIENEIKQITKKRKEAKDNAKTAGKALTLSSEKIENINEKAAKSRTEVEVENINLNEKKTLAEVASERQRSAKNSLERIKNERKDLAERLARQTGEIEENEKRVGELTKSSERLKLQVSAAEVELKEEENELKAAIEHLKTARESSDSMSTKLAELNKRSAMARDERAGLEIERTEIITRLKNLNEKSSQDLNVSLVKLVENTEFDEDFDFEASRKRVDVLRNKLENFGAINMLALEELSETEERLEFLTSQRQDIIDSIKAAEEALREIKRRSRQKFRDAFEAINANFTDFFQELFGGGRGEMTLLEAEDILEAGIEIIAQPPGKRLQNMLLLSGGEKAMTAIALVLAIFKYRPSPFCLLDEVDAPLDDANVGRFVNRIAEMSEDTQFIVITHNKRTMEAAKALYGVTMQEAGISKIVSVRFE
ncbi:MAG: chromosome segregation protein SMC [Acidobacteriota bacterium]|nr:chromosome segregation protein SMC [Acidobacteriota bacterium]